MISTKTNDLLRIGQRLKRAAQRKSLREIGQIVIIGAMTVLIICIYSSCVDHQSTDSVVSDESVTRKTEKPSPETSKGSSTSPPVPNNVDTVATDPKQEEQPEDDPIELEWLPDGARILVERRWLLNVDSGTFVPFACTFRGKSDNTDCRDSYMVFSPNSKKVFVSFVSDGVERFAIGPLEGPFGPFMSIPKWVKTYQEELYNVIFWLSDRKIFIQQIGKQDPRTIACRIYDVQEGKWEKPKHGCISGGFSRIEWATVGPAQLLAIKSSGEGCGSLDFYRYDLDKGQSKTPILSIGVVEVNESISFNFSATGSEIYIITSCRSLHTNPGMGLGAAIKDCEESISWRLFSVSVNGPIVLLRFDLPPGTYPSQKPDRFVWQRGKEICIGDPTGKFKCFSRPLKGRDTKDESNPDTATH
jgi:hypothetical protein